MIFRASLIPSRTKNARHDQSNAIADHIVAPVALSACVASLGRLLRSAAAVRVYSSHVRGDASRKSATVRILPLPSRTSHQSVFINDARQQEERRWSFDTPSDPSQRKDES